MAASNGPRWSGELRFAKSDAKRFAVALEQACGFEVSDASDLEEPLAVLDTIRQEAARCCDRDRLVLYFAGHGHLVAGELYLLYQGSQQEKEAFTSLPASFLFDVLKRCRASHKLLILDCCNAGAVAGYRGADEASVSEAVEPWSNSFQVLAAGERVSRAREIEPLGAGFFTATLIDILTNQSARTVSTETLAHEAQRLAARYNVDADEKVPIPLFMARGQGVFLLKEPAENSPIVLSFVSDHEPDMVELRATAQPYARWDYSNIVAHAPLEIHLPETITKRIKRLEEYLDTDVWPSNQIGTEARRQTRQLVTEVYGSFKSSIETSTRLLSATATRMEQENLSTHEAWDLLFDYLRSKVYAFLRMLASWRFVGEEPDPWMQAFFHYDFVYGDGVLNGLAPLVHASYLPLYWTDARLYVGLENEIDRKEIRVYVPRELGAYPDQWTSSPASDLSSFLSVADFRTIVGVQFLDEPNMRTDHYVSWILRVTSPSWEAVRIRDEHYIDTICFNPPQGTYAGDATQRRIVTAIVERLKSMPPRTHEDFWKMKCRLMDSGIVSRTSKELQEKVREAFEEAESALGQVED